MANKAVIWQRILRQWACGLFAAFAIAIAVSTSTSWQSCQLFHVTSGNQLWFVASYRCQYCFYYMQLGAPASRVTAVYASKQQPWKIDVEADDAGTEPIFLRNPFAWSSPVWVSRDLTIPSPYRYTRIEMPWMFQWLWMQRDPIPGESISGDTHAFITVPHWLPFAVALLTLYFLARPIIRERRTQRSLAKQFRICPTCSYDLRSHAPGNKCPECGTPVMGNTTFRP